MQNKILYGCLPWWVCLMASSHQPLNEPHQTTCKPLPSGHTLLMCTNHCECLSSQVDRERKPWKDIFFLVATEGHKNYTWNYRKVFQDKEWWYGLSVVLLWTKAFPNFLIDQFAWKTISVRETLSLKKYPIRNILPT